jgi:signal transduction histidine kinase
MRLSDLTLLFPGDSELSGLMRDLDWSTTDMGVPERWPEHWRTGVRLCLTSQLPVVMHCGPTFTVLYNDPCISFLGPAKHPRSLGRPGRECWSEIWETIGPMFESVLVTGKATSEAPSMVLARQCRLEEGCVRFTAGPLIAADGSIDGLFCIGTVIGDGKVHEGERNRADCGPELERTAVFRRSTARNAYPQAPDAPWGGRVSREQRPAGSDGPDELDRPRVLVADDNADMRAQLTRLLREQFEVKAVADGEDALSTMDEFRPDLIISDVIMPRLDGLGLLRRLRSNPQTAPIPLILLSAQAGEEWRIEALAQGADDYLVKPFAAGELIARATAQVESMHLRRQIAPMSAPVAAFSSDVAARKRAGEALRRLDRLKDAFLASLSHELHTPLNAVVGWTKMLLDGTVSESHHRRMLESIYRHARDQEQLIADLLDVSRIVQGQLRLDPKPLRAMDVVRGALESIESPALAKRIAIEVAGDEDAELVADGERLRQVIWNLLSNAIKFTPEGGRVLISVGASERSVIFEVQDTGIGIEPEMLPHLFERFWQGDSSSARAQQGLGLALVRYLVELHGGAVAVVSDGPEKGSRFIIALPAGAEARDSSASGLTGPSWLRPIGADEDLVC